jgi:hypothetical protein
LGEEVLEVTSEIHHKPSSRQIAKTPTKEEATRELVINIPTPISEETQLQEENPLKWLGKKWLEFLQN